MGTKTVSLSNLARELDAFSKVEIENLRAATLDAVMQSIPDLVKSSPVDTGLYAQSWNCEKHADGVSLINYAPHAPIIEWGARPFTPPLKPLLEWAKRVLTKAKDPETGKTVKTGQPESGYTDAVWRLAVGTQKKIAARGMSPKHVATNLIPKIVDRIRENFKRGR